MTWQELKSLIYINAKGTCCCKYYVKWLSCKQNSFSKAKRKINRDLVHQMFVFDCVCVHLRVHMYIQGLKEPNNLHMVHPEK